MQDFSELEAVREDVVKIRTEQHKQMVKSIIRSGEKERQAISEEFYENVNQVLAAIKLMISNTNQYISKEGVVWLKDAQFLLADPIQGIRGIANQLCH